MDYQNILIDLDELKELSNYNGTRVAAILYDRNGEKLCGNWCESYNTDDLSDNQWVAHAEQRVIAQAGNLGLLRDAYTIAVSHSPCLECSKLILSVGITRVIVFGRWLTNWKEVQFKGAALMEANGVEYINLYDKGLLNGTNG